VGRSKTRAYAYLTHEPNHVLTETVEKRLKVLGDLDSLGAGFQLASHDLDIRGAGNLVGDEQSGHIKEVGSSSLDFKRRFICVAFHLAPPCLCLKPRNEL
jgi:transcription-repair coupling factor (superfamily II helicase)